MTRQCSDFDNTIVWARKALEEAKSTQRHEVQAQSYLLIARVNYLQGNDSSALLARKQALSIAKKNNVKPVYAKALSGIGSSYAFMNRFDSAVLYIEKSIELFPDSVNLMKNYGRLGIIYRRKGEYERAISNYLKSLDISVKLGATLVIAKNHLNIGNLHRQVAAPSHRIVHHYQKAIEYLKKSGHLVELSNVYSN